MLFPIVVLTFDADDFSEEPAEQAGGTELELGPKPKRARAVVGAQFKHETGALSSFM